MKSNKSQGTSLSLLLVVSYRLNLQPMHYILDKYKIKRSKT